MLQELVYAGKYVEEIIKKAYPQAVITDESDYIHTERFSLDIEDVETDEFYPFAIRNGFVQLCFSFQLLLQSIRFPELKGEPTHTEIKERINKWIEASRKLQVTVV